MSTDDELRTQLAAVEAELAAARAELAAAQAESEAFRTESSKYAAQLNDVYASTSWRLSAPVRAAGSSSQRVAALAARALPRRRPRSFSVYRDLYGFVEHIASRCDYERIIDLGCGRGEGLASLHPRFGLVGVESDQNAERCRKHYRFGNWISADLRNEPLRLADRSGLKRSVVVCSGAMGQVGDSGPLLRTIRDLLEDAPFAVVAAPNQDVHVAAQDASERSSPAELQLGEFTRLLEAADLEIMFSGLTRCDGNWGQRNTPIAVVQKPCPRVTPPQDFRVAALMYAYNEQDVISATIEHLIGQGVEVYLFDNWSTDRTAEIAAEYLGRGVRAVNHFPEGGATGTFDLHHQLLHVESIARSSEANWILRVDADEIRESPWPGISLREALHRVELAGFNAIDHTVLEFHPTDEDPLESPLVHDRMRYFEFGTRPGHFRQIGGWKRQAGPVEIAWSGGHEVRFPGRRIYPFKFLLRHYPIRGQEHGERKILLERVARYNRLEREIRGWHTHYEKMAKAQSFVHDSAKLLCFDDEAFYRDHVVERLSGVGIVR